MGATYLILNLLVSRFSPQLRLSSILPLTPPPNKRQIDQAGTLTNNNSNLRWNVTASTESLRPNDIAHTIADQEKRSESGFLGVTGDVGGNERKEGDEGCWCGLRHVITYKASNWCPCWNGDDHDYADDGNDEAKAGNQEALTVFITQVAGQN